MKKGQEPVWDLLKQLDPASSIAVILEHDDCMVMKISGEDGEGIMTLYQVFEGVYLMYNDFHMPECISSSSNVNSLLGIDHCREGRMEMQEPDGVRYYMEQGDLRIDTRVHHSGICRFPLSHYHGITIGFQKNYAEESLHREMPGFSFRLENLTEKFCANDEPFVIRGEPALEHLFYQLYQLPGRVQKEYFKIKIVELLVYLNGMEVGPYKVDKPYFYASQVEKIRAIHELITSDLTTAYTAQELSRRFSIPLTTMKRCFKSVYGKPIYAYLKQYRMGKAAGLLIMRKDLKVSEIGAMVGYNSPSKFTAAFHEAMGQTPLEYRNSRGVISK